MEINHAVAVVGVGAVLPDAPDAMTFWQNIKNAHYSIREVPANRWRVDLYYDPDPAVVDKTYTKIGAWVEHFHFDMGKMGIAIPPRVLREMDETQQWAIAATRQALLDYGYPRRSLDPERVAVILGNAMGGEYHYRTSLRIHLPEFTDALAAIPAFGSLPREVQQALLQGLQDSVRSRIPPISEDTMPGELSNVIAGRVANVFNFAGPNFVTDAACASSLAALQAAVDGLIQQQFDAVITGGVDRNMGVEAFVKFCKIGALSPDGSRPYDEGANGFVMGEGAAIFLLKRLVDAERDGDKIYGVIRGIGSSSDGKGKGITAPNPLGQERAVVRAWKNSGIPPETVGLIEGHGTSTRVGDVAELNSLDNVFGKFGLPAGKIALGSVKSNIGHLKSAAGAAGLLKAIYALHEKILPPSVNFEKPNPNVNFSRLPFYVNTITQPWEVKKDEVRRAGVSSFGFGGTNFHVVLEEYLPGRLIAEKTTYVSVQPVSAQAALPIVSSPNPQPYRGLLFLAAETADDLRQKLITAIEAAQRGETPASQMPDNTERMKPHRLAIDYNGAGELVKQGERALKAFDTDTPAVWSAMAAHGIYRGSGSPGKVAFLFPGQGSQYVNMLRDMMEDEPVVKETFAEADRVMTPLLGRPLTGYILCDEDEAGIKKAEAALRDTTITQPAVLTTNIALLRLLQKFGFYPDFVIGHSLGEYAALVAAGVLTFGEALEIVSARGREMSKVSMEDNGCMAAVSAPIAEVENVLKQIDGYVVLANINSPVQSVIGGTTSAVDEAIRIFQAAGVQAVKIPVSHAFHTKIVAPASGPLRQVIGRMNIQPPRLPIAANVTGEFYPAGREEILDLLAAQVASPVQFVKGIETIYHAGGRVFIEVGPKRVLNSLATDILKDKQDVVILATNHPRKGAIPSFNEALCGLLAAGVASKQISDNTRETIVINEKKGDDVPMQMTREDIPPKKDEGISQPAIVASPRLNRLPLTGSVVISGAGLGLPGRSGSVFDDQNIERLLEGDMRIEPIPLSKRQRMLERRLTRLVKSESGARMELIEDIEQTLKLAGQPGAFDLAKDFGVPVERVEATDISTQLAIAAGIEALRDAGIPLVMSYKQTSTGTYLPNRWMLPEPLRDETGVIFASAFPGLERMAEETGRFAEYQALVRQIEELRQLRSHLLTEAGGAGVALIDHRINELQTQLEELDYHFDRRFIFRILAMGHSQFAEYVGARGPNTHVNAACASTTQAIGLAEDWVRNGRCRRVVVIAGDDVTGGNLINWVGSGLLVSGAATTEGDLRRAALPFDQRRNGMIMGMGAAALVVEAEDAIRERGVTAICEILATQIANSAFHGTRLDVDHVSQVMEQLMAQAEERFGVQRSEIAAQTVFVSHETYTPARGGSAAAEIAALRHTFGDQANRVVIANTKGYTGHTMGVGVEDVLAVKALQYGKVPPIAHLDDGFQPDPALGDLNLSRGGEYPVKYALRLGAGFGSQIAMALFRQIPVMGERVNQPVYQNWLRQVTGQDEPELEVVQRTLRVRQAGPPVRVPTPSRWQFGQVPTAFALKPGDEKPAEEALAQSQEAAASQPALEPSPVPSVGGSEIAQYVLNIVSDKTGYPVEMLDLGLDLEADLGIDTVKQAELFAVVREHYQIPRREDLRLVDYNTLEKVIRFVQESLATVSPQKAAPIEPTITQQTQAPQPSAVDTAEIKNYVLSVVSEKTGYPMEMLDLGLDLEADLGIDTVKQAELFAVVREHYQIPRREDLRLVDYNTLEKVIRFVEESLVIVPPQKVVPPEAPVSQQVPVPQPVSADAAEITNYVLGVVSEKTGYPVEMLDLGLDLEADLGIDTVKQAELFAVVREHYQIPRREDLRLVDYNTLDKVIHFVRDSIAATQPDVLQTEGVQADRVSPEESEMKILEGLREAETDKQGVIRRVPLPVVRPRLELCLPTGISLGEGSRVLIVADHGKVGDALARKLRGMKVEVLSLKLANTGSSIDSILTQVKNWKTEGKIDGVYFLPALDAEDEFPQLTFDRWHHLIETRLHSLAAIERELDVSGFLICATRLDGLHGYHSEGAASPTGGAVSGFAKSLAFERAGMLVKVIDFDRSPSPSRMAEVLVNETLHDPAVVEVGWRDNLRFTIVLKEHPLGETPNFELPEGSVFVITGGSGGIVHPVVLDLAKMVRGKFYLLARSALPAADDPDLLRLKTDLNGLRKDWMARSVAQGERLSPAQLDQKIAALERGAATLELLSEIRQMGSQAHYLPCDITDAESVAAAVAQIAGLEEKVDVLIHAAGMERSRKLESKPEMEFRQVFSVKADGFFHLFKALERSDRLPRSLVLFSSVAGRFGNAGQTDYSAANDWLSKQASSLRKSYPMMKTIVIDWGAWAEVGMASRGHIPELMKRAGIDMLQPSEAAPLVRMELLYAPPTGEEVVLAGSLGLLEQSRVPNAGLDVHLANQALQNGSLTHPILGEITGMDAGQRVQFEAVLNPEEQPFLRDHALNNIPLFPGVMGIEGFSAAAQYVAAVLASKEANFRATELSDVQFLIPLKFYRNESRRITWKIQMVHDENALAAYVALESTLQLRTGESRRLQHFSGKVTLQPAGQSREEKIVPAPVLNGDEAVSADHIYRLYFHGPAFQVLDSVQRSKEGLVGRLRPIRPTILSQPQSLLTAPELVELCLQTAGVWEAGATGVLGLPKAIGELHFYLNEINGSNIYSVVQPIREEDGSYVFNARVVDENGKLYLEMRNYRTSPMPYGVEKGLLDPLKPLTNG